MLKVPFNLLCLSGNTLTREPSNHTTAKEERHDGRSLAVKDTLKSKEIDVIGKLNQVNTRTNFLHHPSPCAICSVVISQEEIHSSTAFYAMNVIHWTINYYVVQRVFYF